MKGTIRASVAAALAWAAVLGSTTASAQTNPWSASFDLGVQTPMDGDVHGGGSGTVLGLPTQVTSKSYGDVYGAGFYWAGGLGYGVGERGEIRVQGSYTSNPAESLQVGTVAGLPLLALFEDYQAFGMDFGYRQYLGARRARPFLGAGVGFVRLQTVTSEFSVPAAGVVLSDVDFFESSVVPAFGVGGGLQVDLSDRVAVQGGLDFRWHGDAKDRDGLAGTGLEPINDESRRWSMPITAGVTVRF
jgi:opacity protein-like surface antigen